MPIDILKSKIQNIPKTKDSECYICIHVCVGDEGESSSTRRLCEWHSENWFCWSKVVFQGVVEVVESGPFLRILLPAVKHNLIKALWAAGWWWHPIALLNVSKHVLIRHPGVRNTTIRDQFHKQNSKGPHIRLDAKPIVKGSFRCCPLQRKFVAFSRNVFIIVDQPSKAKIGNLYNIALTH